MVRESSWARLGTDVKGSSNLDEVLQKSHLDFEVIKRPLYTSFNENGKQKMIKLDQGMMMANVNAATGQPLGLVSKNYEIIQNRDAFDFVDSMGESIIFEKAGQTASGMMYIIARLADREILGDTYQPFVILENSFNGAFSLKAAICPLRIVCQNQLRMAFKNAANTVMIRHTGNVSDKIENARKVLMASDEYLKAMNLMAEKLATIKISGETESKIIDMMYPMTEDMSLRKISKVEDRRMEFLNAYDADDNQNFKGTLYGFINAAADIDTHSEPTRKKDGWEERRFIWTTDSEGILVPRVMQIAESLSLVA